ncbi:hypothetical protein CHISP_1822 [Chitinispirillum alkaliphilum]|nr:hypothetical protein CHISP_1822 [Chitinispirillum alkaliphilum]
MIWGEKLFLIIVVSVAFIAGIVLYRYFSRLALRLTLRRRFSRGAQGEKDAFVYLRKHGYRILETQAARDLWIEVDGEKKTYEICADYIALHRGRKFVVEVKTGTKAANPLSRDTRRQLLEYAVSYDVDAVFLFDADKSSLMEVSFPLLKNRNTMNPGSFAAGFFAAVILFVVFVYMAKGGL